MSNFLAVAAVTAAIQRLLQGPVAADVPGAVVTTERPDNALATASPKVNLYLYQAVPSAARRNEALPSRRADASVVERPRAALDLGYLISFFGDEGELEPARLLGSTVRTLTARPLIGPALFDEVVVAAGTNPPVHPALATSDVAATDEPVRLCPVPLDLDSLSKLWSVFFQTPYALSVAWSASVIVLEEPLTTSAAQPVVTPFVSVAPQRHPAISAVSRAHDPDAPLTTDQVALVRGRQLAGEATLVRLGGVDLPPKRVTDQAIEVDLAAAPPGALAAGTTTVEVVQRRLLGVPPTPRDDVTSRPFVIVLHPRLTAASVAGGSLDLQCQPAVGPRQEAVVQLALPGQARPVRVLPVPEHADPVTSISVALTGVAPDTYDVVLIVAGAPSDPLPVVVS